MIEQVQTSSKLTLRVGAIVFIDDDSITISFDSPRESITPGEEALAQKAIREISKVLMTQTIPVSTFHEIAFWTLQSGKCRIQWFTPKADTNAQ